MSANMEALIESLRKQGKLEKAAALIREAAAYKGSDKKVLSTLMEEVNWKIVQQKQEEIVESQDR